MGFVDDVKDRTDDLGEILRPILEEELNDSQKAKLKRLWEEADDKTKKKYMKSQGKLLSKLRLPQYQQVKIFNRIQAENRLERLKKYRE